MVTQENMPLSSRFHSTLSKVTSFDAPHFPRALLGRVSDVLIAGYKLLIFNVF
jgi:hypothetical protein